MVQPDEVTVGDLVSFVDANVVAPTEAEPVVVLGVCNGPVTYVERGWYVPVWAARDGGREPTTIWVHQANVLGVKQQ